MTTIISIVLLIVLVSASTYAVVVNVKENNEVLEIVNEVNIIDLVTDNDGVYNNTYYNVRNELDITDSEASIIIQSDSLNEALHLVLQSLVDYKINKNNSARLSNQELYNLILEYTNKDEAMPSYLKDKIIDKSNIYITDVNDFLYIIIIFLLLLLFIINNDLIKMVKIISIISILTGIFIQIISKIIVFIINSKVTYISTIKITNRIINEFNYPSFIFLLVGILSYILYLILNAINKKIPLTSS